MRSNNDRVNSPAYTIFGVFNFLLDLLWVFFIESTSGHPELYFLVVLLSNLGSVVKNTRQEFQLVLEIP